MQSELNETTRVVLTSVTENGVPVGEDQSRGASINADRSVALITVTANDDPFGVVLWSGFEMSGTENDQGQSTVTLTVLRTSGIHGDLAINYMYVTSVGKN